MGKKLAVNEKAAAARQAKQDAKSAADSKKKQDEEDAYWDKHANPKTKSLEKRENDQKKKEETAARKAELKKLAAEEEAAMASIGKKKPAAATQKVTQHQLLLQAEAQRKQQAANAAQKASESRRDVSEDQYASQVDIENSNRDDTAVDAHSVDSALQQLSLGDDADRHPEKRAKAAWEAFFERELPIMKETKPGLKLMQYKSRIFEKWQRSPENPRNQQRPE